MRTMADVMGADHLPLHRDSAAFPADIQRRDRYGRKTDDFRYYGSYHVLPDLIQKQRKLPVYVVLYNNIRCRMYYIMAGWT